MPDRPIVLKEVSQNIFFLPTKSSYITLTNLCCFFCFRGRETLTLIISCFIQPLGVIPDHATRPFKSKQQVAVSIFGVLEIWNEVLWKSFSAGLV